MQLVGLDEVHTPPPPAPPRRAGKTWQQHREAAVTLGPQSLAQAA